MKPEQQKQTQPLSLNPQTIKSLRIRTAIKAGAMGNNPGPQ